MHNTKRISSLFHSVFIESMMVCSIGCGGIHTYTLTHTQQMQAALGRSYTYVCVRILHSRALLNREIVVSVVNSTRTHVKITYAYVCVSRQHTYMYKPLPSFSAWTVQHNVSAWHFWLEYNMSHTHTNIIQIATQQPYNSDILINSFRKLRGKKNLLGHREVMIEDEKLNSN